MDNDTIEQVRWRDIPGYEGLYQASDSGLIRRIRRDNFRPYGMTMLPHLNSNGYLQIYLQGDRGGKHHQVHRLVMLTFVGEPPSTIHQVNHINGITDDNRLENLEYVTPRENALHSRVFLHRRITLARNLTDAQINVLKILENEYPNRVRYTSDIGLKLSGTCKALERKGLISFALNEGWQLTERGLKCAQEIKE